MQSLSAGSIRSDAAGADARLAAAFSTAAGTSAGATSILECSFECGRTLGHIEFDLSGEGTPLSPATRKEFAADLCRETARLEQWAAANNWPLLPAATSLQLRVAVAERFKLSKSLVPAWSGHPGRMEFPAWRVARRKAAIAHELVHVFAPNGNRLLAEGLAVYLQAEIGGNPAFPNFGEPLHALARRLLQGMASDFRTGDPARLDQLRLSSLDLIATPAPLTLMVMDDFYGEEPRGQLHLYAIAGSFVAFLIETRGLDAFRQLYLRTPLVAFEQNSGSPERWAEFYGRTLDDLTQEWKALLTI
jgi:hypothetical protein